MRERCLDFAERYCLKGYPDITERRRHRLWQEVETFLTTCLDMGATGWEKNPTGDGYPCDVFGEHFAEYDVDDRRFEQGKGNRFFVQLRIICRLSFDVIDGMPGGVFGIALGELRRSYNGQLPDWLKGGWQDPAGNPVDIDNEADGIRVAI